MKKNYVFDIGGNCLKWLFSLLIMGMSMENISAQPLDEVSLDLKNVSLKRVLDEITAQTGYSFAYTTEIIEEAGKVSISVKKEALDKVLRLCLAGKGLGFEFRDKLIVISPKLNSVENRQQPKKKEIKGVVYDKSGAVMPGVTVQLKGSSTGIISDENGVFVLNVSEATDIVLVFSFVGMRTKEVAVKGDAPLKVVLEEEVTHMEEVVVTGIFQKKKDTYTGAVSVITEKDLKTANNKNLLTAISTLDPSFNMLVNNEFGSDPNRLPDIQIRGVSSLPNLEGLKDNTKVELNVPLIIMDGFEIDLRRMMDLNQNEVASITLLKDGTATALYGSRGANGVIVITTKEPEAGKLRISYNSELNIEIPDLTDYHLLNAKDKLELERLSGFYNSTASYRDFLLKKKYAALLEDVVRGVDTYWLAKPLRTGVGHRHGLRLEGGDKSFRYSASLQYNGVAGVMKESDRNSFNGGINLSYHHEKLIFRNDLTIGITKSNDSPYGNFSDYAKLNPYWTPYDDKGKMLKLFDDDTDFWGGALPKNPLYNATLHMIKQDSYTNISNKFSIEWRPWEGFIARGRAGISTRMSEKDDFKPARHTDFEGREYKDDGVFRKGRYVYGSGRTYGYEFALTLNYSKLFAEKHLLYAGLNMDITSNKERYYNFVVEGFVEETLDFLGSALQYQKNGKPSGSEATSRRIGVVSNLNYAFDNRYYVDIAYRTDGSSQFGKNKRFAPFYSAGLGWNIHREHFMEKIDFIDRLKLRFSYGQTGSQKFNVYQALTTYGYYLNDRYFQWLGSYQKALGNPDLEWQITDKWNAGLEVNLWKNRLSFVADIYWEQTSNLLSSLELFYSNGFTSYVENVGKVENRGFELKATAFLVRDTESRFIWTVSGALVHNRDKVVKLSEAMKSENAKLLLKKGGASNTIIQEGESQNTIYVVPSLGIDPNSGRELFLKKNGEVSYTWDARDRVAFGLKEPKYRGNFSTNVRWKAFTLSMTFDYRFGGQLYNATLVSKVENADKNYNVDERVLKDRWKEVGDRTFFKGLNNTTSTYATSRFVQDEKTLAFKNLHLSYEFQDNPWLKTNLGIHSLSLSGNASDLFHKSTIKQERGLSYPFARRFSFSLSAWF